MKTAAVAVFYAIGAFYGYGALVHVLNIAGLGGFDWAGAPLKWQALDVVYLVLDLIVCLGFFARWRPSLVAFGLAAVSQIVLYSIFRDWIIDVPEAYALTPEQTGYLTTLVVFHVVTLALALLAYRVAGRAIFTRGRKSAP